MGVEYMFEQVIAALPETSRRGRKTIREVCLTYDGTEWIALAGGHPAVHIGEWGGDFRAEGPTAENALHSCLQNIKSQS